MRNISRKASGTSRRVMALAIAAALCLSTLAAASPAEAAGFTKPKLAVKKKTLYYNKKGKKTYTLKVKSNKVKKIVSTTWKTSKKSVISISKKKKMSVKLTAKKKGKATVTATVQYVPKGKWMVRTVTLKCKVTSKKAAVSKATPSPVKATPTPTSTNGSVDQQAAMVELSQSEVTFNSTEEGENTTTLTAAVKNAQGKKLEDQEVTWSTDNDKVAGVDDEGTVTAKKEGTANITASAGSVKSAPCVVTVDTTAPTVEGVRITDYKTITAYFDEPVEGDPKVSVTRSSTFGMAAMLSDETVRMTPVLAKDGRSLTMTSASALPEGTYNLVITGLSDRAGNELAGGEATAIKQQSRPTDFVCRTEEIPAGQDEVNVFYNVVDQYGETMKGETIGDLKAEAVTESGMPLDICVEEEKNCLILSGTVGKLAEGRKILITLSSKNLGLESEFTTVLVDPTGVGKAVKIEQIITSLGDSETPEFTLDPDAANNVFTLSAELSDKFGSPVTEDVIYAIKGNKNIAEFVDEDGNDRQTISAKSDEKVKVRAKNKGELTITAYLASDDSLNKDITITIKPTQLEKIIVGELASGYNMQESQAKITLEPLGTGLTAKDLKWEAVDDSSKERIQKIQFEEASDGSGIYVGVTAKGDSRSDRIRFKVYYEDNGGNRIAGSDEVIYDSKPMPVVDSINIEPFEDGGKVPASKEIETSYELLNRYGENITTYVEDESQTKLSTSISGSVTVATATGGILKIVAGMNKGEAVITLKYGSSVSASVKLEVQEAAYVKEAHFGKLPEGEKGLIAKEGETVYIPVTFYDQYTKEFELKQKDIDTLVTLELKCNGVLIKDSDISQYVSINYVKEIESGKYEPAAADDKVQAIALEYEASSQLKEGDVVTLSWESSREGFVSDKFDLSILETPTVSKLRFAEKTKSAAMGATVTNKVAILDQYEKETSIDTNNGQTLEIRVTKDNKVITLEEDMVTRDSEGNSSVKLPDAGTYVVTVYVSNNGGDDYTSKSIQDSYTLTIDDPRALVKRIEISDAVTKGGKSYDLSKGKPLQMETGDTSLIFTFKAYDTNETEIVLGNTIPVGELEWTVSGSNVTANVKERNARQGTVTVSKGDSTSGAIKVSLSYVSATSGSQSADKTVNVSWEPSKPEAGTYGIVIPSDSSNTEPSEDDTIVKTAEGEVNDISGATSYRITALDQYGEKMYDSNISTIYAEDSAAVLVRKDSNGFTVMPMSETEKTTRIHIRMSTGEELTFAVKGKMNSVFEEKDITTEWEDQVKKFAEYYNGPANSQITVSPDDGYFAIPLADDSSQITQITSVKLGNDTLSLEPIKVSVGNNSFAEIADYQWDDTKKQLLISYVYVALHNTNSAGKMIFTVEYEDVEGNSKSSAAVLKVKDMQEDLTCKSVVPAKGEGATVQVQQENNALIPTYTLELLSGSDSNSNWDHLCLLTFSKPSTYYFTKKVTKSDDGTPTTAYGFTMSENSNDDLGYYPPREGGTVEYTVATLERHGVAQITLNVKGYEGNAATID